MKLKAFTVAMVIGVLVSTNMTYATEPIENGVESLQKITEAYKVESKEAAEAVKVEDGITATILVEQAKLREKPSPEADIVHYLAKDLEVTVKERVDSFYKVTIGELEGYVYKSQIDESNLEMLPHTITTVAPTQATLESGSESYLGEKVVSYAKQFLGNPYVYGGNSLTRGADCSGFTQQIYKKFNISLQRSSRAQHKGNGYLVSKAAILPGDLVFYGFNGYIDHVAIYAGNGQIVHANSPKTGIKMSKLEYGKPIIGIKRVIQ